jgi:hypothetical protein
LNGYLQRIAKHEALCLQFQEIFEEEEGFSATKLAGHNLLTNRCVRWWLVFFPGTSLSSTRTPFATVMLHALYLGVISRVGDCGERDNMCISGAPVDEGPSKSFHYLLLNRFVIEVYFSQISNSKTSMKTWYIDHCRTWGARCTPILLSCTLYLHQILNSMHHGIRKRVLSTRLRQWLTINHKL